MTKNLNVRLITEPDPELIAKVTALEKEAFGRGGLNEWHLPVIVRHGRLYILFEDERVAGAASLIKDWSAGTAYLFDFVIDSGVRGKGYGRLFLEEVLNSLKAEGVSTVELSVAPENQRAIDLYEELGFEKKRMLSAEYGKEQDRWLMETR